MDKNPAYPKEIKELKAAKKLREILKLRQSKYLNNIVEQDHPWHETISQARDKIWVIQYRKAHYQGI